MLTYLIKRLGLSAAVILAVTLMLFSLLQLIPGDPATIALGPRASAEAIQRYSEKMHLDKPVLSQFVIFVRNLATGDLGIDVFTDRPVATIIGVRIGPTPTLFGAATGCASRRGLPRG